MAYIVQRNNQFYVVVYDGVDPRTGNERRPWHPAGRSRDDAEAIAARLEQDRDAARIRGTGSLTVEAFLTDEWLPRHQRELRPSTARRDEWFLANYIAPAIGHHRFDSLRAEHRPALSRPARPRRHQRHAAGGQDGLRRPSRDSLRVSRRRTPTSR